LTDKVTTKNQSFAYTLVLTNSARRGIVPQAEHFDKDIAVKENIDGHFVMQEGDLVYNPRISVSAPCGPIHRNNLGEAGLCTLFSGSKVMILKLPILNISFRRRLGTGT